MCSPGTKVNLNKTLFVGSCAAMRFVTGMEMLHFAIANVFDTEEEARTEFVEQCFKRFPISEGWTYHTVAVEDPKLIVTITE